jgi:TonB family protein
MLATRVHTPVLGGTCGPDPSKDSVDFTLVRGLSEPQVASTGTIERTLCIDADRKLVVWDEWEVRHSSVVYIYSRVDAKANFPADTFAFEPPPGSTLTDLELPTPHPLGTRGIAQGPGISSPRLVAHTEPQYGEASREARIQGAVVLYVVIGIDGKPTEVLVYQHLSSDLDDEAVRTVAQWRFTPATRNGQAVAISITIEINFRLG